MTGRAVAVNVRVSVGGRRILWLVVGLVLIWGFSFHFTNPWDAVAAATSQTTVVFVAMPLYLLLLNTDLLGTFQSAVITRVGSTETWWWGHVLSAGAVALLMSAGLAVLAVVVAITTGRWTWHWGLYGRSGETPEVLAHYPWTVPWHWSLDALLYLCVGLWAVGVLRHTLSLWWRRPWLAWVAVVALGLASRALSSAGLQSFVWWLPGSQFSYGYHWGPRVAEALGWTVGYAVLLLLAAAVGGLWFARGMDRRAVHGEVP